MATVTIKLKCRGNGIETDPKKPKARKNDNVRWVCDDGPWWIVFKSGAGPLYQPGLNSGKGNANAKGSKVKVMGRTQPYYYAAAIWNVSAQKFCTEDPPLDIVPGARVSKKRSSKKSRKGRATARKRSRANR